MIYDYNLNHIISWGYNQAILTISRTYFGGLLNITRVLFRYEYPIKNLNIIDCIISNKTLGTIYCLFSSGSASHINYMKNSIIRDFSSVPTTIFNLMFVNEVDN